MSSDHIEVLRENVRRWRKEESRHEECMNSVGPDVSNYHEGMSQAFGECADELDAALASLSAPKPSGDWVLVPREATPEMWEAGMNCHSPDDTQGDYLEKAWGAMLAAAPKPESAEAVGTISQSHPMMGSGFMHAFICKTRLPEGTKVYTAPPRPEASEPVVDRAGAVRLAQAAAYASHNTHDYLPHTAEEARNWQPHEWVVDAILAATLDTAPQQASAPVGVEGLPGEIRNLASEFTDEGGATEVMLEWADRLERALAQQPAPVAPVGDSLLQTALRNLPQYISKSGLVGPDKHSAMQCFEVLRDALAQQPAAPPFVCTGDEIRCHDGNGCECAMQGKQPAAVDGAMVDRAITAFFTHPGRGVNGTDDAMRAALTAALAGQQQGGTQE